MLDWHRLFGTMMLDRCYNTAIEVTLELEVSHAQQFLDCALLRKPEAAIDPELPDGFAPLAEHTLLSFKSVHEPVNAYAIEELIGYAIAYRKLKRLDLKVLLPPEKVRLMLIATRFPEAVARKVRFTALSPGVYDMVYGMTALRLVVIHQLPWVPQNAPLLFFSAVPEAIAYARSVFAPRTGEMCTSLLNSVLSRYGLEGLSMPFTAEDFMREHTREVIERAPVEERLHGLSPEARLSGLAPETVLKQYSPEARLSGLSPEDLNQLERLIQARKQQQS